MKDSEQVGARQACKGYRFTMTAIMFGRDAEDAFSNLLDALQNNPEITLEEGVEADLLDYVYVLREDLVGET